MPLIIDKKVLESKRNEILFFFCEWYYKSIAELASKFDSSRCWILYWAEWSPYDLLCASNILQSLHLFPTLLCSERFLKDTIYKIQENKKDLKRYYYNQWSQNYFPFPIFSLTKSVPSPLVKSDSKQVGDIHFCVLDTL